VLKVNIIDLKEACFNQKNLYYLAMLLTGVVTLVLYIFHPEVKGFALGLESRLFETRHSFMLEADPENTG